ncbi:MAG: hypothetical protein ACTSVY_16555 [Candidatus Helarchaeota archaeon]
MTEQNIQSMMAEEPSITAVAVLQGSKIVYQTPNWDVSADASAISRAFQAQGGGGSINIQQVKYMLLDVSPDRLSATNLKGQGHIVGCPCASGHVVAYVDPQGDNRGALMTLQKWSQYI